MNVYCYFEALNHLALPVIELWKQTWSQHGWNPIVLGRSDFEVWPKAVEYEARVSKLPTINNPAYELACYRRWGAMAHRGGGLMTDYDVINFGLKPEKLASFDNRCFLLDRNSPAVVCGDKMAFEAACEAFADYRPNPDQRHTSDMHISTMLCGKGLFVREIVCEEMNDPGWDAAMLVHFPTCKLGPGKEGAIKAALELRKEIKAEHELSLIIPAYKKLELFRKSLFFNYPSFTENIQVVLVLDCPDEAKEYVNTCKEYPYIHWKVLVNPREHEWRNPAKALNVGLRHATGKNVLVCSPETIFVGDVPGQILQAVEYRNHRAICGRISYLNESDFDAAKTPDRAATRAELLELKPCFSGTLGVSRFSLLQICGYNEQFDRWGLEDLDVRVRLEESGCKMSYLKSIRALHIQHNRDFVHNYPRFLQDMVNLPAAARWTTDDAWGRDFDTVLHQQDPL